MKNGSVYVSIASKYTLPVWKNGLEPYKLNIYIAIRKCYFRELRNLAGLLCLYVG